MNSSRQAPSLPIALRPLDNVRAYIALLRGRTGRRQPARYAWKQWTLLTLGLVVPVAYVVDPIFGRHRGEIEPFALSIAAAINEIGSSRWMYAALVAAIAVALLRDWRLPGRRRLFRLHVNTVAGFYALAAIVTQELVVSLLKQIIGRARPNLFEQLGPFAVDRWSFRYDFTSFPSGHAATIGCAAACFALLYPRYRAPALIVALWIGFSRVVIGAHYPSDVIAGLMFGAWVAYAFAIFVANRGILFVARPGHLPAPAAHVQRLGLAFLPRPRSASPRAPVGGQPAR